tara:strand:+ start:619 stop:1782 length:1164 start_codon:yes stop_codon:yes gene_type:complete
MEAATGVSGVTRSKFLEQPAVTAGIAAAIAAALFSVPMVPYLAEPADLWTHIEYAKTIHQLSDIKSPHFLFQVLLIGINRVVGVSYEVAAIGLMSFCYAFMAAWIALRIRVVNPTLNIGGVAALAVLVLLASHVFLQSAFNLNFYYGYIAPTTYHNPTQVLSKALAVPVLFAYVALTFEEREGAVWPLLLPVGIVLSAIAKPSFLIAFVPCVCAVEISRAVGGRRKSAARNVALVAIPACVVLLLQYLMAYGGAGSGGLGFAPFLVYGGAAKVLTKLPGSLLFPVAAAAMVWRQRTCSHRLLFAWFLYAVGMTISVCFVETGGRMMQGNFAWTGQTVTFLLYVESVIALLAVPWQRAWPAWGAFALHVLFGIIWYLAAFMFPLGTFL